ncbi:hypothetical protein P280DRAFT_470189 [Massarina eburnea CBS 473.64]|uniref:Glycosyltransferase family 1 protein n=1 Tax=Massarina eburnea CBS 473.64 TaxID=1395130 RepID=A0A6A6RX16_9PLEO|nr:hypothetical protein P280DRAFT_470189 [Massarina eburnea CBS 473.64]
MTASTLENYDDDARSITETDQWARIHVEIANDTAPPPAYTITVADYENAANAEAYQPEKPTNRTIRRDSLGSERRASERPSPRNGTQSSSLASPSDSAQQQPRDLSLDYFAELTDDATVTHAKRCNLLRERLATWHIKRKGLALCPLSATILIKEGLLRQKDLELISRSSGLKRDPTDPISAVAFGAYDTLGDMILGLMQGPVEFGRQIAPMMKEHEANPYAQNADRGFPSASIFSTNNTQEQYHLNSMREMEEASLHSSKSSAKSVMSNTSHAALRVAISSGKGIGRIVGAGVKAPMTFTHGVTRGFHNMPKLYGEEVREYENVVDLRSGLMNSGKGLAHGFGDGITDFFRKPVEGAKKEGILGFGKGVGKGFGNLICKPTAGVVGIVGYTSAGMYKEIQGINSSRKKAAIDVVIQIGEVEYERAGYAVRIEVVRKWHDAAMKK